MGNCKFPILDEKLEMVCDKGDIYHCQYLKSNHGKCRRKEIVLEMNFHSPKTKNLGSLSFRRWMWIFIHHKFWPWS